MVAKYGNIFDARIYYRRNNPLLLKWKKNAVSAKKRRPGMTEDGGEPIVYRAYSKRWLYLVVAIAVNFSNGNTWITYAAITFQTNAFYGNNNAATFLNVIFMALSIPVGFLAIWWIDKKGLRSAYMIGAWTNLLGNCLRFAGSGTWIDSKDARFGMAFSGQTIAAFAQPFVMFLPTKLAAFWFPENERALANTLASMSNPIGIAVMYSLSPSIVNDQHPDNFAWLTGGCLVGAVITALLSLFITTSNPPTPVSASRKDGVVAPPFLQGIWRCLKSKRFMILAWTLGGGVGAFNALYNNLQPALCAQGYSQGFNGGMGALLIGSGLIGAAISGIIVDQTGAFEAVMKTAFGMAGLAACSLAISVDFENQTSWVVCSIIAFGITGFAVYPIGLEAGVEATYPVGEFTSTGLIIMIGQVEGIIYVVITTLLAQKPDLHTLAIQTCVADNENIGTVLTWKYSFLAWLVIVEILIVLFTLFFRPKSKRRMYEQQEMAKQQEIALQDPQDNDYIRKTTVSSSSTQNSTWHL